MMFIAYLMPNDADSPRDGLGYLSCAPTEQEAIERLKTQFSNTYEEMDDGNDTRVEFHTNDPNERPHFIARWKAPDGVESAELYWLHTAEENQ